MSKFFKDSNYVYKPDNPNVKKERTETKDDSHPDHSTVTVRTNTTKANGEKDTYVDKYFTKK